MNAKEFLDSKKYLSLDEYFVSFVDALEAVRLARGESYQKAVVDVRKVIERDIRAQEQDASEQAQSLAYEEGRKEGVASEYRDSEMCKLIMEPELKKAFEAGRREIASKIFAEIEKVRFRKTGNEMFSMNIFAAYQQIKNSFLGVKK